MTDRTRLVVVKAVMRSLLSTLAVFAIVLVASPVRGWLPHQQGMVLIGIFVLSAVSVCIKAWSDFAK